MQKYKMVTQNAFSMAMAAGLVVLLAMLAVSAFLGTAAGDSSILSLPLPAGWS